MALATLKISKLRKEISIHTNIKFYYNFFLAKDFFFEVFTIHSVGNKLDDDEIWEYYDDDEDVGASGVPQL